mgnify:CR=1 FL=1
MSLIQITDNCDWTPISNLTSEEKIEMHINNLQKIANVNIREVTLAENPNLLIFPRDWALCDDEISENRILSLQGKELSTGNVMGFIGINDTQLKIKSRFAKEDENDYFLHYMLQKVFSWLCSVNPTPMTNTKLLHGQWAQVSLLMKTL